MPDEDALLMDPRLADVLERLQRSGFADLKGTRASARVPLSERLLNDLISETLPPGGAVRQARLRPRAGNRVDIQVKLARPAFLPPLNITAVIERQADLPESPEIVLKLTSLPGVMAFAGGAAAFLNILPPGVRMAGDRVFVHAAELARQQGHADLFALVRRLHVTAEDGAVVLDVDLAI